MNSFIMHYTHYHDPVKQTFIRFLKRVTFMKKRFSIKGILEFPLMITFFSCRY